MANCSASYNSILWQNQQNRYMSGKLPILAGLVLAVAVALMPDHLLDRGLALVIPSRPFKDEAESTPEAQPPRPDTTADTADAAANGTVDGQRLVAEAAEAVFRFESLTARIRLRVHLFEQNLTGTGRYFQLGPDEDKLLRLDLKIRTFGGDTRLQQVCDGRNLWLYRDSLPISRRAQPRATVSRVDLRRVQEAGGKSNDSRTGLLAPGRMVQGGLAHVLKSFHANFDFQQPDVSTLSGVPMWTVRGRWKPEKAAEILAEADGKARAAADVTWDSLPAPLPHEVVLVLAQRDLFPFQIQYLRSEEGSGSRPFGGKLDPILTIELFEVATEDAIDPRLFQFQPPTDLEVDDETSEYLARLGESSAL